MRRGSTVKMSTQNPQFLRESFIRALDEAPNSTHKAREMADDLFALDLTVYSRNFTLDSIFYSAFAQSKLNENIIMHPEQIEILKQIKENAALIVSAPTSFGKTFCVFEYIALSFPKNIVLIVPTLALVDEYLKKIIKVYQQTFSRYKIHTQIDENKSYDFDRYNIFILTHDRVVNESAHTKLQLVDFLVIDEVYKLEMDQTNDRILVLNMAYYHLAQKAAKYVLLAPFIKSVEDIEYLEKNPHFYNSNFSPVVNDVITIDILRPRDRFSECHKLSEAMKEDKTLIYFPTVTGIYKYVNEFISNEPVLSDLDENIRNFVEWAKDEIHEDWCLVKALERGYLIHNGQLPMGTRLFQMDFYEKSSVYNRLLCTSTLLEGVNTTAKNIIITKPSRVSDREGDGLEFSAFDFFNLVGRTGRLNEHLIGKAYYIKAPNDPVYVKNDAIKSIRFELTDDSKDIDIQKGDIYKHQDVLEFLKVLNITLEEYLEKIGGRPRFDTVKAIYDRYAQIRPELLSELQKHKENPQYGRLNLIKVLYSIIEKVSNGLRVNIINSLLHRNRPKIKSVVDSTMRFFSGQNIDYIISTTINLKMSYIEHDFYSRTLLVRYFLEKDLVKQSLIDILDNKVIGAVEQLYFATAKHKKMLLDLGVYERDIDRIIRIIGDDFDDASELKRRLINNIDAMSGISFVSKYIIRAL